MVYSPRSFCCDAPVYTHVADEGTSCYICCRCHSPCDARLTDGRPRNSRWLIIIGIIIVILAIVISFFLLSAPSAGKEPDRPLESVPTVLTATDGGVEKTPDTDVTTLPPTWRTVTAYTSTEEQTDATPCLAADGSNICHRFDEGETLCAANFVPFGTVLMLDNQETPDGEDAVVCVVADRLASKYPNRVDLYMGQDTARAVEFGKRTMWVSELSLH